MKNFHITEKDGHLFAETLNGKYIGEPKLAENLYEIYGISFDVISDEHNVCSIGFSEREQKWYGWSHRAIFGFGIGSEIKKGDCAYIAATPEELIDDHAEFFADFGPERVAERRVECQVLDDRSGIRILHSTLHVPIASSVDDILDAINDEDHDLPTEDIHKDAYSVVKCGKGAWKADTLEDAKQMAIDFANGVA